MTRALGLAALFLAAMIGRASAADILSLEERDIENGRHTLDRGLGIVDVNSTVLITLDRTALRAKLGEHYPETRIDEIQMVRVIQNQVREGLDALPAMGKALVAWSNSGERTQQKQEDLKSAIARVADAAIPILIYATQNSPSLDAEIQKRLETGEARVLSQEETYFMVFDAAAAWVAQLTQDIDARIQAEGIYVQMGAWLDWSGSTQALHLPGFDTLPPGDFYQVERWQLAALLSQQNKTLFDAAQQAARDINSREKSIASLFRESLPEAFVNTLKADHQCLKELDDPLRTLQGAGEARLAELRSEIDDARQHIDDFIDFARTLQARYGNLRFASIGDVPTLYMSVRADVDALKARANALEARLKALQQRSIAIATDLASSARVAAEQFSGRATECRARILENVENLASFVKFLANGREIGTRSLEFSEKVLKHDIASLPERANLELRHSGARDAGAAVIVRIAAGQKDGSTQMLDEQQLRLYKVLTYVDVAVSLIFADPAKDTGLDSRFQAAPSYSVLLKRGKRDSVFWNELLRPGIGVNIAALDFNKDSTLEIGAGLVLSAFRDFLQVGYGYNLNEDSAYWFLGLRFPMPGSIGVGQ